jgi:hypothetical protein
MDYIAKTVNAPAVGPNSEHLNLWKFIHSIHKNQIPYPSNNSNAYNGNYVQSNSIPLFLTSAV